MQPIDVITLIIIVPSGLFAFIKWLDERNKNLKNERYKQYCNLIRRLSGSRNDEGESICMTEQISSAWILLEYKEYYNITLKILDNPDLEKMSDEEWRKFIIPQIKNVIKEIKNRI